MNVKASPAMARLLAGLALLLLLQSPSPILAARAPSVTPVLCQGQDLSGLTAVNVTAGQGQIKLLANEAEACENAGNGTEQEACAVDWKANRKAERQLGRIVAKINEALQKQEIEKYDKLKKAAKDAKDAAATNTTDSEDPEPFEVLEEPPAELNLTATETAAWKATADKLKGQRRRGRPNPKKSKPEEGGFSQQLKYVCHQTEGRTVMLYMRIDACTATEPCDDFDTVE